MVRPRQLLSAIRNSVETSGTLPDSTSYLEREPATTGQDGNIKLPVCTFQTIGSIRLPDFNTDQVEVIQDSDGNNIGRRYHAQYRMDVQIDLWVAQGSSYDADVLGDRMRRILYQHDSAGPDEPLRDEDGQELSNVWRFEVGDGERRDDVAMTPSLRRWMQEINIWANEVFETTEDYIVAVDYPKPDEFDGGDGVDPEAEIEFTQTT